MRHVGLAAVALAAAATTVAAQEVSLSRTGSGARAAGMGNAFIAVSDDGTAASWNPAGLSQLLKPEFSLVHSTGHRNRYFEGFRTRDESAAFTALATASSTADIEFASGAVPFRSSRSTRSGRAGKSGAPLLHCRRERRRSAMLVA